MFTFLGGWEILLSQYFRPRLWVICLMSLDDSRFGLWCYEISTFSWASKLVSLSVFTLLWVLVWITKLLFGKVLILLLFYQTLLIPDISPLLCLTFCLSLKCQKWRHIDSVHISLVIYEDDNFFMFLALCRAEFWELTCLLHMFYSFYWFV